MVLVNYNKPDLCHWRSGFWMLYPTMLQFKCNERLWSRY